VAALEAPMTEFEGYLRQVRDELAADWELSGRAKAQLVPTLGHTLRFSTWASLRQEGLTDSHMVDLASVCLACIVPPD
jgi:hypothetical protein